MLLSLQTGLQSELHSSISQLTDRLGYMEDCTEQLENQITEVVKAYDEMVDAHKEQAEEIFKLQLKVEDSRTASSIIISRSGGTLKRLNQTI